MQLMTYFRAIRKVEMRSGHGTACHHLMRFPSAFYLDYRCGGYAPQFHIDQDVYHLR